MNIEIFKQAQAKIAASIGECEVLSVHAKRGKIAALVNAAGNLKQSIAPAFAGAGIAVLATVAGAGISTDANAQNWNGYGAPNYHSYPTDQQQQAYQQMQQRAQRQAEEDARQKREVEARTASVIGDVVANIAGQVAFGAGGNYNQSNSVRDLSKQGVNVAFGHSGNNTAERVGIGALAGAVLAGMFGGDNKSAGIRAAVGGAVGAGAGYAWDKIAESKRAAQLEAAAAPVYSAPPVYRAPQPMYQPQAQPQYQPQHQTQAPRPMSGGIERQSAGVLSFTRVDSIPAVRGAAPSTAGKTIYEPGSMGLPAVMVEVARSRGIGIVAPGTREVTMTQEAVKADPLLDNAFTSMAITTDSLAKRIALMQVAAGARDSGNQMDVGQINQQIAQADSAVRENIGSMLNAINTASASGNYNTKPMMDLATQVVGKGYTPDGLVQYRPNTKYSMAPR